MFVDLLFQFLEPSQFATSVGIAVFSIVFRAILARIATALVSFFFTLVEHLIKLSIVIVVVAAIVLLLHLAQL